MQAHTRRLKPFRIMALCAVFLLLAACHDEFSSGTEAPAEVSATITSAGGSIQSADGLLSLVIPAGALPEDTEVTIVQAQPGDLLSSGSKDNVQFVYDLKPDGLTFAVPAQIRIERPGFATQNAESIDFQPVVLGSESGDGTLEILSNQSIAIDEEGNATLSGSLSHFSHLAGEALAFDAIRFSHPTSLESGQGSVLAVNVRSGPPSQPFAIEQATGTFTVDQPFSLSGALIENPATSYSHLVTCTSSTSQSGVRLLTEGVAVYDTVSTGGLIQGVFGQAFANLFGQGIEPPQFNFSAIRRASCSAVESNDLRQGLVDFGVKSVEAIQPLGGALGNLGSSASFLAAVSTDRGNFVLDLKTGEIVLGEISPQVSTPDFGLVAASQPNPGVATPAALFGFAAEGVNGSPFGGALLNYSPNDGFDEFFQFIQGSFTDADTAGGTPISNEILACANGLPKSIQFNAVLGAYELAVDANSVAETFAVGSGGCVSMATAFPEGAVLSINGNDRLYYIASRGGPVDLIGTLGSGVRRIRHLDGLAVASIFNDSTLRVILWDGVNSPSLLGGSIAVGNGPVGIDILRSSSGGYRVVSTGFNDDTLSVVELDSAGALVSNDRFNVPTGCSQPAHVAFIENEEDAQNPFVVGTCFGSGQYFLLLLSALTPAGP